MWSDNAAMAAAVLLVPLAVFLVPILRKRPSRSYGSFFSRPEVFAASSAINVGFLAADLLGLLPASGISISGGARIASIVFLPVLVASYLYLEAVRKLDISSISLANAGPQDRFAFLLFSFSIVIIAIADVFYSADLVLGAFIHG